MTDPVLVRVAPEILAVLESGEVEPVVLLGAERAEDGTYDLILKSRPVCACEVADSASAQQARPVRPKATNPERAR
jgi:hypothetical protein